MTRARLRILIAVVILAAGMAAFWGLRPRPPTHAAVPALPESPHGLGMDQSFAGFIALYHAPEGSTPCETAYNAYKASLDEAEAAHAKAIVLHLAPRDEFLAACAQFSVDEQRCLTPAYLRAHHDVCPPMKDPDQLARLKQMVELIHAREEPAESSERTPGAPGP